MKKVASIGLVALFLLSLGTVSFAEGMKSMKDKDSSMDMGKGMMGDKKMGMMMGPMMMKMMEKSLVPTSDGGIVLLAGNKITKYDKDLNVMKEVEIKIDMDAMQKEMDGMMKMCPMMKEGMKGAGDSAIEAGAEQAKAGSDPVDHAAHH